MGDKTDGIGPSEINFVTSNKMKDKNNKDYKGLVDYNQGKELILFFPERKKVLNLMD